MTTTEKRSFKAILEEAKRSDEYWADRACTEFAIDLSRLMRSSGVSRAVLARRIGSSPAYVTKVLRGEANFTMLTMVKLARALDAYVDVTVSSKKSQRQNWGGTGEFRGGIVLLKSEYSAGKTVSPSDQESRDEYPLAA